MNPTKVPSYHSANEDQDQRTPQHQPSTLHCPWEVKVKLRDHVGSSDVLFLKTGESALVEVVKMQPSVTTSLLPFIGFGPSSTSTLLHAVKTVRQFSQSNLEGGTLGLELSLLGLHLQDVLVSTLEDSTLVLLRTWDDLGNVLNALIDDLTSTTFN
jgi:hypothetical protein